MGDCSNYKPIFIIVIAYQILAHIILHRLKAGGAEQRILQNQFDFKSKAGTIDALFLARRGIDHAQFAQLWLALICVSLVAQSKWRRIVICLLHGP